MLPFDFNLLDLILCIFRLAGAPLTHDNVVMELLEAGVNVGIGVIDGYAVRNTRFEVAWVCRWLSTRNARFTKTLL